MFVAILQGLLITVLAFLTLAVVFVAWVAWVKRDELKTAFNKSWNNTYTKDEIYAKIYYYEMHEKWKSVIYWRARLYEIYPEENPRGPH